MLHSTATCDNAAIALGRCYVLLLQLAAEKHQRQHGAIINTEELNANKRKSAKALHLDANETNTSDGGSF